MFWNKKKFIPYGRHNINREDVRRVIEVLKSDFLTQGPKVKEFEQNICKEVDAKYGVATNSATSALHIACLSLGLSPGDILWTSPITFVASANSALYCGAKVDFVDIDISTGLMSIKALEEKLKSAKKEGFLPKIVMPVHLAGTSCDMEAIYKLSKIYDFKIIEDASHAIGGKYKEYFVGSCKFSDVTVFSFHPVKIITSGEGGIAVTNNKVIFSKMRLFANHGITKNKDEFINSNFEDWIYEQQILGYNFRMSDIQCALGLSQLKRLRKIVNLRNEKLKYYKKYLSPLPVSLLDIPKNIKSSVHLAIIKLNDFDPTEHSKVFHSLRQKNIGVQLHYHPVHLQPFYKNLGFSEGYLPVAEKYGRTAMTIPLFPEISKSKQYKIVRELEVVLKEVKNN